ncbi:MAG: ATP-binding cassette domain-containing protein, partial [Nitrospiraceae bacterium]
RTILDSLAEVSSMAEMNFLRGIAGTFLFSGQDQKKPIKALSGGERNRVALARMLVEPANTLLLDEPTNHLDPASIDVLTDALSGFPGTIVFISHDPTFLSRVATRVVEIEDRRARDYLGDYEYYLWKRAQELESIKERSEELMPRDGRRAKGSLSAHRRELSKAQARLEKQVSRTEADIAELESQIRARDQQLADPELYQDFGRWDDLRLEQDRWRKDLDEMTATWAKLSDELEEVRRKLAAAV